MKLFLFISITLFLNFIPILTIFLYFRIFKFIFVKSFAFFFTWWIRKWWKKSIWNLFSMLPDALRIRIFELFHPVLILVGTCCARIKENRSFRRKKKNTICDCYRSNQIHRSRNRDCSWRAHLFLSYHLISVPWSGSGFQYSLNLYFYYFFYPDLDL